MKKILFTLAIWLISASIAFAGVFVTPSGKRYHEAKDCGHIAKSKSVTEISEAEAKNRKLSPCKTCYPDAKAATNNSKNSNAKTTKKTEKTSNKIGKEAKKPTDNTKKDIKTTTTK